MAENSYVMTDKQFSSIRDLINPLASGKQKTCRSCGGQATKEVRFEVGNDILVVERYCDRCAASVLEASKRSSV